MCTLNKEESTFHLFLSCPFSRHCWRHLNINWNFNSDFYSMMAEARDQFNSNLFMEVFIITAWLIWKQRNDYIFNRARPTFDLWKSTVLKEASIQVLWICTDGPIISCVSFGVVLFHAFISVTLFFIPIY
jgi:hypothetical protein